MCGPFDDRRTVKFTVPENRRIAFLLSGGADSAVLLMLVCLELLRNNRSPERELNHILTIPKKSDGAELHSFRIVNWINERLKISLNQPIICGPSDLDKTHHSEVISESVIFFKDHFNLNYTFFADQQAVPYASIVGGLYPARITKNEYPDHFNFPFLHLTKVHTLDLHFQLGTEALLELSHSCTERRTGRCNQCYHCCERKWAFEILQRIDPGAN